MITRFDENTNGVNFGTHDGPRWTGPSRLLTIRTAKCQPFDSLLKPTFKDPTAFKKRPHEGLVHLGCMGFGEDEHAYPPHQTPERAVLQYNPDHYPEWKRYLKEIKVAENTQRDALMEVGGFGENIAVENSPNTPAMDETTMCIGDIVAFQTEDGTKCAQVRVNAPRMPCYKLNHRFGIPKMSKWTQDRGWTGWLYDVVEEGDVEVGNQMVLLERPFPDWPVSRIQHYCFKEPKNLEMARIALDTLGGVLASDIKGLFKDRLTKGMEDASLRLQGDQPENTFTDFRLCDKIQESDRVSEFVLKRVGTLSKDSESFRLAKSGSHIRIRMKANGQTIDRPYSVISGDSNTIRLGIALAQDSRGGSAYMHKKLQVGDTVEVSENFANTFPLITKDIKEHVFLAGGIGITAFLDHVKSCLDTKQKFHLHYMIRNKSDYAFRTLLEHMFTNGNDNAKLTIYTSAEGRRCDLKKLLKSVSKEEKVHIYVCGSEKMAEDVKANVQALGMSDARLHLEQFGVDASGDPFTVKTSKTNKKVDVGNRQSLLNALREAGLEIPSSCEAGNCGTCRIKVKCGRIMHKGSGLMDEEKAGKNGQEAGEMLSCVSRGIGTITVDL